MSGRQIWSEGTCSIFTPPYSSGFHWGEIVHPLNGEFLRNVFEGTESAEIEFSEIFHKFPCPISDLELVVAPELFYPEVGRHYLVLQVLRNYIVYIRFDTFICKARLGDILSYVPDLTKSRFWERDWSLGQVENLIWSISGSQDKFDPFAP